MRIPKRCFIAATSLHVGLWVILLLPVERVHGQEAPFGARDLLSEQSQRPSLFQHRSIVPMVGLSLIGPQWRAAGGFRLDSASDRAAVRLNGRWRLGPLGAYEPDLDEWYDILRLISFARLDYHATYARVGPLKNMRLGHIGHIVNYYSTETDWDSRTIGTELALTRGPLTLEAFTGDILLSSVSGGRLIFRLPKRAHLSANYALHPRQDLHAWSVDIHSDLFAQGAIVFAPFVSYARYRRYGESIAFGGDLRADEFIDLFSLSLRMGAFYNSQRFIPGYIGTLYDVQNQQARIVKSEANLDHLSENDLAGVPLHQAHASHQLFTELNLKVGRSFWFRYYWQQHFGAQPLSALHLRLFMRTGEYFEFGLGMDQLGKRDFWSLFNALEEQSALAFETTFRLVGLLMIHIEARYSFEALQEAEAPRYLNQRRFEPLAAVRIDF